MENFLHVHKPRGLILRHARDRNARPQRHDFSHLFLAHGFHAFLALQLPVAARVLHFLQQALLLVTQVGGLLKILVLYRLTGFLVQLRHALFLFLHVRRRGERADAHARRGLVDQVDRLVRQEAVADIPVGQHDRRADGFVGDVHLVVILVPLAQTHQNLDAFLLRRLAHHDRLEPAFQRRVLFNIFVILAQRRRADALHLAARQERL